MATKPKHEKLVEAALQAILDENRNQTRTQNKISLINSFLLLVLVVLALFVFSGGLVSACQKII